MSRFINPAPVFVNQSNEPLIGGKMFFFESGTTTIKPTFADVNLTEPNPHPVLLEGDGRTPNVFFDGSANWVLKDVNDVQIDQADPISAEDITGNFSLWNEIIIYAINAYVQTSDGRLWRSLQSANQGNDPVSSSTFWEEIQFIKVWNAVVTYDLGETVKGTDNLFYRSLVADNLGNDPVGDTVNWGSPVDVAPANRSSFVASGALTNGDVVILNNDGTVSVVTGTPEAIGDTEVFESADISGSQTSTTAISATQVVIAYRDTGNAGFGTAVVGTVSGTDITFGTPVVFKSGATVDPAISTISATQVVIAYQDSAAVNDGTAIVGTVSGTSISFGTEVVFENANTQFIANASISATQVVLAYQDNGNSGHGTAIVGTVSGTSISFGTAVVFEAAAEDFNSAVAINATQVVIVYRDSGNTSKGTGIVGTVSGTSISFGTAVAFGAGTFSHSAIDNISATQVVIAYDDATTEGTAVVGTVSGTDITFGDTVTFATGAIFYNSVAAINSTTVVVSYQDGGNSNFGTLQIGTVSGTDISFEPDVVFNSAASPSSSSTHLTGDQIVIAYQDSGNSNFGTSLAYTASATDAGQWLGITESTVLDTETATIATLAATVTNQSGLTIDADLYVDFDGTLTETPNDRKIGRALSATNLLIEGDA